MSSSTPLAEDIAAVSNTPGPASHREEIRQHYANRLQNTPPVNSSPLQRNRDLPLLTARNFAEHQALHGRSLPRSGRLETWLDGVVDAMEKDELMDPMNNIWSLRSRPEDRIVKPEDHPQDEWNYVRKDSNVRRRGRTEPNDPWGKVNER
ncbi:hypothetical protein CC86DRAFT_459017 [Ophiobolus disseminans]|uniref:Uncharacterized protein n=1 Tax=Ophiobolus disseminans TaxID=1469910 RepID=A0A6A6ZM84_9PLEO|nr:hypothetical protein CC86DRAFT_459017 [Ophiobolus disseminans]